MNVRANERVKTIGREEITKAHKVAVYEKIPKNELKGKTDTKGDIKVAVDRKTGPKRVGTPRMVSGGSPKGAGINRGNHKSGISEDGSGNGILRRKTLD